MDVMIDIETMGTGATAPIISIGACAFDVKKPGVLDEHTCYEEINLQSNIDAGRIPTGSTIAWWLQQNEQARKDAARACDKGVELGAGLRILEVFFNVISANGNISRVWSHGASFDIAILEHAYAAHGMACPWPFWTSRCTRTLADLAPSVARPSPDVAHNALDDAKAQAKWVQEMWQSL